MKERISAPEEHEHALRRLEEVMFNDPEPDSPEDTEIQELATGIEEFEKRNFLCDLDIQPTAQNDH